jgi:hypothetical protein
MECTLRSWLRVPSPIIINVQDKEKMLRQQLTLVCQYNFDKELMMDHELDQLPDF